MTWPAPRPGLVIHYSYLWHRESLTGQEEGLKDRPCAVVVAVEDKDGRTRVYALPITHSAPAAPEDAVEVPAATKARLGLDGARSWIVTSEANVFVWPGPDLRRPPGREPECLAYGFLPPRLFRLMRERFLAANRMQTSQLIVRTE